MTTEPPDRVRVRRTWSPQAAGCAVDAGPIRDPTSRSFDQRRSRRQEGAPTVDPTNHERYRTHTTTLTTLSSVRSEHDTRNRLDDRPDDSLDVRLHAPTPDTVIVWLAGPLRRSTMPLLMLRVRQQLHRATRIIIDLSSVTHLDCHAVTDLLTLRVHSARCGVRLHIAGGDNGAIAEPLRLLEPFGPLTEGNADAVLASLPRTAPAALPAARGEHP
jgi:ABC-type transporter Mla MlaB component